MHPYQTVIKKPKIYRMNNNTIQTSVTKQFGIKYPIFLAGMHIAAGPELCAAVSNAGGIGVLGALSCKKPEQLDELITEMKEYLNDKNAVFGVDLVIPKVGEGARKTNKAYHDGPIEKFLDVVIKHGAKLVVTAIGAPSQEICDKLHDHGIAVMSMIGSVKHLRLLLDKNTMKSRVDLVCCQGGEGGGHTGSVPTSLLIPSVVDAVQGFKSVLTGNQIPVVAAGGMYSGRSLVAALSFGASAIWVGTRFVATEESGAPLVHKKCVLKAGFNDTVRSSIYTGRPCRVYKTNYVKDWENNRSDEIAKLTSKGIVPFEQELTSINYESPDIDDDDNVDNDDKPYLMGETAAVVKKIQPAREVVEEIMTEALGQLNIIGSYKAKL